MSEPETEPQTQTAAQLETVTISAEDRRLQHAAEEPENASSRYKDGLTGIRFDATLACATNGRILACRAKTSTPENKGYRFVQNGDQDSGGDLVYMRVGTRLLAKDRDLIATEVEGRFPIYQNILNSPPIPPTLRVGLDAAFLLQLAKAISPDGEDMQVVLEFGQPGDPIFVAPLEGYDCMGVIMPLDISANSTSPTQIAAELVAKIVAKPED